MCVHVCVRARVCVFVCVRVLTNACLSEEANQQVKILHIHVHNSGGIYTTTLLMNTVTLVFVFTQEVQRLHEVVFGRLISRS